MDITRTILFLPIVFFISVFVVKADCPCKKISPNGFSPTSDPVLFVEKKPFSKIQGKIAVDFFGELPKAHILLFRKPTDVAEEDFSVRDLSGEKILFACETGKDGKFCFKDIPRGKYVVCADADDSSFTSRTICTLINSPYAVEAKKV